MRERWRAEESTSPFFVKKLLCYGSGAFSDVPLTLFVFTHVMGRTYYVLSNVIMTLVRIQKKNDENFFLSVGDTAYVMESSDPTWPFDPLSKSSNPLEEGRAKEDRQVSIATEWNRSIRAPGSWPGVGFDGDLTDALDLAWTRRRPPTKRIVMSILLLADLNGKGLRKVCCFVFHPHGTILFVIESSSTAKEIGLKTRS
jgi:hypothetical protein